MYRDLLVAVDNSTYAERACERAVELAQVLRAKVTGAHVTNAGLHAHAFRLLEASLPNRYQNEQILHQQREIHADLIQQGLFAISDSYLMRLRELARTASVSYSTKVFEGRHYEVLAQEIDNGSYDLAVFGSLGLGSAAARATSTLGGVVNRVARRIRRDLLVVKEEAQSRPFEDGRILVAVDGSERSNWALRKAIALAARFEAQLYALHVFDPEFHRVVFQELVGVLSGEAAEIFDLDAQQKLHDKVIDNGLEEVGQRCLRDCEVAARHAGIPIQTTLLRGRFCEEIVRQAEALEPSLLVIGRWGRHRARSSDLGSTAEDVLRVAPCSVLIVSTDLYNERTEIACPL